MKKTMSVLLALVLLLALSVPAMAISGGTITIDNAVVGQSYTLYEILYLESYNAGSGAYSYKATTAWADFIDNDAIKGVYVHVDAQGYVTWKDGADAAAFAKLAQKYAVDNSIGNQGSEKAVTTTVTFENLELGYYLVDSTLGTLCSLDTTNPTVTIKEKNAEPTNVKTVEEDSTPGVYGQTNDADIGQTVNFKSTITARAGAENYVFHDKMSTGLTYTGVTGVTLNGDTVAAENYTVKTEGLTGGCTFEVEFTQAFCDTLQANDRIVISYTATVNENAVIGTDGNPNESKLSYGEEGQFNTTPSQTKTYTWKIDVLKYTVKDGEEKTLSGAKFTLNRNSDGSNPIALIAEGNNVYRVAKDSEESTVTEITTDDTGAFTIKGLDSDTYYLTETAAPAGYNRLAGPVKVVIGNDGTVTYNETSTGAIKVLNNTGAELPSTGGVGTTVFYVVGGLMVLLAVVLLVTRKKMSAGKD